MNTILQRKQANRLGSIGGQSLLLAVIVMFLLVFIAAVFVAVVVRNQARAGRSKEMLQAQYLCEAGIQYADKMLRTSELGADWRPVPDNLGFIWDPQTKTLTPSPDLANLAKNHPDFKWLRPYAPKETAVGSVPNAMGPTGGYTSFTMGEGRFLLRVSYNPDPNDPESKYIKIESIGRIGVVDPNDPTTWDTNVKLRRELTAYKPIGVTDYLRFITNKEKRSADFALGAPGFDVKYGSDIGEVHGAPIRVNGNVVFYGDHINIYLRGNSYQNGVLPIDRIEVAGDIKLATDSDGNPAVVTVNRVIGGNVSQLNILPSSDSSFTTGEGFVRDGSDYTDVNRYARSIKRIEAPLIDSSNTPTKVPRYLSLTRDSGAWVQRSDGRWVNSGRYGWGRGVYIDNRGDLQPESETLFGGYTPPADWMKPNNKMREWWKGPYYIPPGVVIILNPYDTDGDGKPDITITRTDTTSGGRSRAVWRNAIGEPMYDKGSTITIPYPCEDETLNLSDWGAPQQNGQDIKFNRNGVIYAEGNVRIRGMLAPGKKLTVVSGGIIYIEGNLLKYRDPQGNVDDTSAIALLAKNYVCVNTTQFTSLLTSVGATSFGSDSGTGDPPYHLIITPEPGTSFLASFSFGPDTGSNSVTPMLFIREAGQYGPSYINMWLNRTLLDLWGNVPGMPPPYVYGVGDPRYQLQPWEEGSGVLPGVFHQVVWPLSGGFTKGALNFDVGIPNIFEIALDQSSYTRNNYLLGAFTIQPMDIRIEAVIYAQERSFYVLPGNWFNQNPEDYVGAARPKGTDPRWPYFGQPLDIKITIDGAITENFPAPPSDVNEWYSKWSNIPAEYGSSGLPTAHPHDGLTFMYDPKVGWPVRGNGTPIRTDAYGRALPITPCLPVCESLVYYGESL